MRDRGIGPWIEHRARTAPDRVAMVFGDQRWTYAEMAARITRLANVLRGLGVAPGDRIGWLGPNHPAFLETLFATAKLGAALAPVNHRLDAAGVGRILEDSAPRVVVAHASTVPGDLPPATTALVVVGGKDAAIDYEHVLAGASDAPLDEAVAPDDLCMLPYTSGTTSGPKGVMLTHANVTWNVVNVLSGADFRAGDVTLAVTPFFRTGGTGVNVLPTMFLGGTVVIPEDPDPGALLDLMERHEVTVGFGNPDILEGLTRTARWKDADLTRLRFIITGGAPVPERLIRACLERNVLLLQGYGLSEAAPVALLLDSESALTKGGSAGKPPLLMSTRIVRPDGNECEVGETGELLVAGPNVMRGYWNRPEATERALDADGWLHTGDAARADDDGYISIVDRLGDRFTARGVVVYPGDVERLLLGHPAVADAGVTGIEVGGETVGAAFVVLTAPDAAAPEELLAHWQSSLRPHQLPEVLHIVPSLPRSSVGKLLRHELAALVGDEPHASAGTPLGT
ncbi:MAG: AMP-binding protein [Dehalococcoidia bacterium]|nr:AMP-binding protein [Dehalococcoidia bacterium]